MAEYTLGKATTRKRKRTTCNVHLTVSPAVYQRLEALRDALQKELGPAHIVTIASITRRLVYSHPLVTRVAHRYPPPEDGNSLVREEA